MEASLHYDKHKSSVLFAVSVCCLVFAVWVAVGYLFQESIFPERGKPLSSMEKLGEVLFHDRSLSEPAGLACAGCHVGQLQRQGNNKSAIAAVAAGSKKDSFGRRNVPSTMYAAFTPPFAFREVVAEDGTVEMVPSGGLFWDGRADTLEEQAKEPLFNKLEMNNANALAFAAKLKASPSAKMFQQAYGDIYDQPDLVVEKFAEAIAAYERTAEFSPFASKFDNMLRGKASFSPLEAEGFELFKNPDKGNCISCHAGKAGSSDPRDWPLTDYTYDVLAAPRNKTVPSNKDPSSFDLGLCLQPGLPNRLPPNYSLLSLCGAFKVPTLRNVAITSPYFHNGSISTLREAVMFYATRDTGHQKWYGDPAAFDDLPQSFWNNINREEVPYDRKPGQSPRLSEHEVDALVAFLETLTDPEAD